MATDRHKTGTDVRAADLIMERGVRFRAPVPRLLRPLGLKLTIRPPYLGTVIEVAREAAAAGLGAKLSGLALDPSTIGEVAPPLARCLALALLNGRLRIRFFSGVVTRYLLRRVTPGSLLELYRAVQEQWRVEDFIAITSWVVTLSHTQLRPATQSAGSQESEDSIAPSDLLASSSGSGA